MVLKEIVEILINLMRRDLTLEILGGNLGRAIEIFEK